MFIAMINSSMNYSYQLIFYFDGFHFLACMTLPFYDDRILLNLRLDPSL
ncbi:hypothetical protein B11Cv2_009650 [Bartonella sp. 1-1C]|nr:hypothetical protein B11Cv2_009650 [Bartonella sp. 1-1C]